MTMLISICSLSDAAREHLCEKISVHVVAIRCTAFATKIKTEERLLC
jgi:hypothetical protein